MSQGLTPIQLIVLSGLLQDRGLQIPDDLTGRLDVLRSSTTVTGKLGYIARHPLAHSTLISSIRTNIPGLAGVSPTGYRTEFPVGVRDNDIFGSINSRAQSILGNGLRGLLEAVGIASGISSVNYGVHGSLSQFENYRFSDVHLNATNYTDFITHGFTSTFGPTAAGTPASDRAKYNNKIVSKEEIKNHLTALGNSLTNLSKLYDFNDLATIGQASNLLRVLSKTSAYYSTTLANRIKAVEVNPATASASEDLIITQVLKQIIGTEVQTIVRATGFTLPGAAELNSAADLLIASKILTGEAVAAIPGGDLTQLGDKLIALGANRGNIDQIATLLTETEVPELTYLNTLQKVIPTEDATAIRTYLPTGTGVFGNPTINDILGSVTGYQYDVELDAIIASNAFMGGNETYQSLSTHASTYITELQASSPTTGTRDLLIADITALVNTQNLKSSIAASTLAIKNLVTLLVNEINNSAAAGLKFNTNLQVYASPTLVDNFYANSYRSANYFMTVQNGTAFETTQLLLIHNGTDVGITTDASAKVGTVSSLGTFSANIRNGQVDLWYTASTTNSNNYYLRKKSDYNPAHDGTDPATLSGSSEELGTIYRLIDAARDPLQLGVGDMLTRMATADYYGDAIRATIIQAKNGTNLQTIGINAVTANPQELATQINGYRGSGLTTTQINIITAEAQSRGANVAMALSDASLYGINKAYYRDRGYPEI